MTTLYLLIRNLDTKEASGLIRAKDICDECFESFEKKEGSTKIDFYNNFFENDIVDITSNTDVEGKSYSDLATIERKFIINSIGKPIKRETKTPHSLGATTRIYSGINRKEYLTYITESLFETYSELAGLPIYEAFAIKHDEDIHQITDRFSFSLKKS